MNIYEGLLFLHGHVASAELARQLGETEIESVRQTPLHQSGERACSSASASSAPSGEAVG